MKKFGQTIRVLREGRLKKDSTFTLRKFAVKVGLSPTYLCKIERDEFPPPAEDKIVAIARELGVDQDELLALSGKVASDLSQIILKRPRLMSEFLRKAGSLDEKELKKITRKIEDGDW